MSGRDAAAGDALFARAAAWVARLDAADCTRAEQRARAWLDASGAIKKLRRARAYDKALARLAVFTKRWGEDDQTRALRLEIVDEREHPLADPSRNE